MAPSIRLRPAAAADTAAMVAVQNDAFRDDPFHTRCFPRSDAGAHEAMVAWVHKNLADPASHLVIAEDADAASADAPPPILGWARWVRRPLPGPDVQPSPPLVFTADMYPAGGDPAFAARFFQANYDAMMRAVEGQPVWFLSMIVVAKEHQRRGVASELMRFGVNEADREGWAAYVNASRDGKFLYERFGFRTVERSDFGDGLATHHMFREAVRTK